jgi:rRNA processing protein Gar1
LRFLAERNLTQISVKKSSSVSARNLQHQKFFSSEKKKEKKEKTAPNNKTKDQHQPNFHNL